MNGKTRLKKIMVLFWVCSVLVGFFSGCVNQTPEAPKDSDSSEVRQDPEVLQSLELVKNGAAEFILIRPDKMSDAVETAIQNLYSAFEEHTGAAPKIRSDWIRAGEEHDSEAVEILIGGTNYRETAEALEGIKYYDYVIRQVGNKLVIAGNMDEKTVQAVHYFINNIMKPNVTGEAPSGSYTFSESDNYRYRFSYKIPEFTVLGSAIEQYRIVIPEHAGLPEQRLAKAVYYHVKRYYGKLLDIVTDAEEPQERELVIGQTNRGTGDVAQYACRVRSEGNRLFAEAGSFYGYEELMRWFQEELASPVNGSVSISATDRWEQELSQTFSDGTENVLNDDGDLRILYHNIYGYNFDEKQPIEQRVQQMQLLYEAYSADVLALQEVTGYARTNGLERLLAEAGFSEAVPDGLRNVNCTPVFYRADELNLLECSFRQYSDGMGDITKSYTATVFQRKSDGKVFSVVSTHFWYQTEQNQSGSDAARVTDAKQLLEGVQAVSEKYHCPVFFGGDLNCNCQSEAYQLLSLNYSDVQAVAKRSEDLSTHHAYPTYSTEQKMYTSGERPYGKYEAAIDHVFLTGSGVCVDVFDVVTDLYSILSSDHCPLFLKISFE